MKKKIIATEYVLGFLFNKQKDFVLLIEKQRPDWQNGRLNGVGGHVEPDEIAREAIRREFREETGLFVQDWGWFAKMHAENWSVECFWATGPLHECKQLTDERLAIMHVRELQESSAVIENLKWLIPLAIENRHFVDARARI